MRQAFLAEEREFGDARLTVFVTASRLDALPVRAALAGGVRLIAARAGPPALEPGGVLAVSLIWQAGDGGDPPPAGLRGFLQLVSAEGEVVAAQEGEPAAGYAPSGGWPRGALVEDRRGLLLPADLARGEYSVVAGLYDAATGRRLALSTGADVVVLATVSVE